MFELIDNTTARLNDRILKVAGVDANGCRALRAVDTTTYGGSVLGNRVQLRELKGVTPAQFPEDFYFALNGIAGEFRRVFHVVFTRKGDRAFLGYAFDFQYAEWDHHYNLNQFMDDFCGALRSGISAVVDITRSSGDGVLSATLHCSIPLGGECPTEFGKIDHQVAEIYRTTVARIVVHAQTLEPPIVHEPEFKWWLRYIIVPLLSAGLGALVVWLARGH